MTHAPGFSGPEPGILYLTEGGTETEVMFRYGHQLREFAMFELLDNPAAVADLKDMYRRYLDAAARHGFGALMAGFDYRASPDWGEKLGYSPEGLAEMQHRCIDFLREVSAPYRDDLPDIAICGCVGPRGDAYALNRDITAEEAEEYHATQLDTLKACDVDLVWAATFNNVPEAVGLSRAAAAAGLPLNLHFTLTGDSRLRSGPSLRESIEATDAQAGDARPESYGINCSHPVEFEPALEPGGWTRRIRALRPNAAKMDKIALCKLGHIEDGDPEELGRMMGDLARRYPQIDIWGGCCGTWDRHFDEIAREVRAARDEMPAAPA
ncbi:homocysteine S-methyltransferase family protein [Rhodosalinus halophilus]|uniref:Homocysteine S-methyltransferase family protein n=1 Tax=Rhodosalinus halophilus TaxID=2259333 RepID=A0A365UE60_9RHOB|nr:homocysteine S-methyltransferase family protein [Rhodosalinus halophilus]RBI87662.1 homocysteine S-methyltransferase family protein [Rhodosalinus halophilus]